MAWDVYARYASEAVRYGVHYLLSYQSRDGFWRDYRLPPGMSESWSTSWVGWSLLQCGRYGAIEAAVQRAAHALCRATQVCGWGYNRRTSPDADSTAWTLRFLAKLGIYYGTSATSCLERYLDTGGAAHTFINAAEGRWTEAHSDVTPIVGLALLSVGAPDNLLQGVRQAVLDARQPGGTWKSFWWVTDAYATAWSILFLASYRRVPATVAEEVGDWLRNTPAGGTAFECAHRLLAAVALDINEAELESTLVDTLLCFYRGGRGWEPSNVLLVPRHLEDSENNLSAPYADSEGLMTTAIACAALQAWLSTKGLASEWEPESTALVRTFK
jgi:hypothetical protein